MEKAIHCDCGFEARAAGDDELVAEIQRHASEGHGMRLSYDEALLLVFRAELDEKAPLAIPHKTSTRTTKEEQ